MPIHAAVKMMFGGDGITDGRTHMTNAYSVLYYYYCTCAREEPSFTLFFKDRHDFVPIARAKKTTPPRYTVSSDARVYDIIYIYTRVCVCVRRKV